MDTELQERPQQGKARMLPTECIKLSGRSDVFTAKSTRHSRNGMVLITRRAFKPGTYLIVRILDFPPARGGEDDLRLRAMGLAEVRWVEEVMEEDGLTYEMGIRYVYTD